MKSNGANIEDGICLPGEKSWDLWKQSSAGWQLAQSVAVEQGGGPASFKNASVFGYPVSAAFAVPVRAATGDEDLLPDIVDFQLEKQGLKPETPVGRLMDYRTVEREDTQTLLLATVLNPDIADDLPREAPQRFEVSPYLFYLPDDHLVLWKELGRIVFCVTRGDQPAYYHALSTASLTKETAPEIEQLLMPLYTQGIITEIKGIVLWTDAVEPGAADELTRVFGARVRSEPRPKPTVPQEISTIEPVSVAMGKIRVARLRKIRNIALACLLGYLAVPGFFAVRYFLASRGVDDLRRKVSSMRVQYGNVESTLRQWDAMDAAINPEKFPIELVNHMISPLYKESPGVRITSVEINRNVSDEGVQKSDITIKGEATAQPQAILYGNKISRSQALKEYKWDTSKVESKKGEVVPFTFTGNFKTD
jgi:hypothetical protein